MAGPSNTQYVSRGGDKLAFALDHFVLDPAGRVCADLGANVGGFVDCLLQRGANRVYAIDTGYGELAWRLRKDDRVVVMERTNAMHVELPEPVDLVTIDVAWTRQHRILPAALRILGSPGDILSLIKLQYEAPAERLRGGVLAESCVETTLADMQRRVADAGITWEGFTPSPIRGGRGNREWWGWVRKTNAEKRR